MVRPSRTRRTSVRRKGGMAAGTVAVADRLLSGTRERRWGCLKGASRRELLVNVRKPQHSVASRPAMRGATCAAPGGGPPHLPGRGGRFDRRPVGDAPRAQTADEDQKAAEKAARDILKARRQAEAAAQAFADAETQVAQTEEDLAKVEAEQAQVAAEDGCAPLGRPAAGCPALRPGGGRHRGLLLGSRVSDQLQADQYAEIAARRPVRRTSTRTRPRCRTSSARRPCWRRPRRSPPRPPPTSRPNARTSRRRSPRSRRPRRSARRMPPCGGRWRPPWPSSAGRPRRPQPRRRRRPPPERRPSVARR